MRRIGFLFLLLLSHFALPSAASAQENASAEVHGRPLAYWTARVKENLPEAELAETVGALAAAMSSAKNETRVAAADALTILGPQAKGALDALLAQLGHESPWVREASMDALASIGEEAVPALIETFANETGGPSIRAAFVLGGIGPGAKDALPVLEAAYEKASPVMQDRLMGILRSIAPERYGDPSAGDNTAFDPDQAVDPLAADIAARRDWPEFHGPRRDAICREEGLLSVWSPSGPKLLWELEGLGRGYSTVSIAGRVLYTMGDLSAAEGKEEQCVLAYDLATREPLWRTPIGPPNPDGGPRCTPTVDGDAVYVIGTEGDVVCLKATSGDILWRRHMVDDFEGKMMSVWKFSESPLIDGEKLICTPGGDQAALVALDKTTGETIWSAKLPEIGKKGADGAGYSSAVVAEIGGVRQYVQLLGRGVIGVDAETGRLLWAYNDIANTVANITTPVVRGAYVLVTTAYSTGAALLKIERDGDAFTAREVYFIAPRDFQNHHGGVVLVGDYLYGGHGLNRGDPTCIHFATGEIVWKARSPARGSAGVLYADGHLVFRYDRGEVVWIEATPEGMKIQGQFAARVDEGPAWAHPVIHNGRLFLRHANLLCCYDLRAVQ
ncbi:MAG: outer membrane protein assembly factor BamB family protein [Pirellulaceae bacterium]